MKVKSFFLTLIMLCNLYIPIMSVQAAEFYTVAASEDGRIKVSGQTMGDLVTIRSLFFGTEKPSFPRGIKNFKITTEQLREGEIDMNYFNVISAGELGAYSADIAVNEYGYYLITASSNAGENMTRLYLCNTDGEIIQDESADLLPTAGFLNNTVSKDNVFEYGNEKFLLLGCKEDKVLIMPYSDMGSASKDEINSVLENVKLPGTMEDYKAKVSIPTFEELEEYADVIGIIDGVGYYSNEIWRVMSNATGNRDVQKYKPLVISENSVENIRFANKIVLEENIEDKETVVEFTAPEDGEYQVTTLLSGEGTTKLQLSALQDEKIFDNNSLAIIENSGSDNTTINLSKDDKLYLHIYPVSGMMELEFTVSVNGKIYSLTDISNKYKGWWIDNSEHLLGISMYPENAGEMILPEDGEEFYLRPVITLEREFFAENKINLNTAGGSVPVLLRTNFTSDELVAYNIYELNTIFNPLGGFEFEVLPFTDGKGSEITELKNGVINANVLVKNSMMLSRSFDFVLAVYSDKGTLLKMNSEKFTVADNSEAECTVSAELDNVPVGAYAKTFLWNSIGGMIPVTSIAPRTLLVSKLAEVTSQNQGNWKFYTKDVKNTDYSTYTEQTLSGTSSVTTGKNLPFVSWSNNSDNVAYIRPECGKDMVIEYTVPNKGNWKVEYSWTNIGLDVYGGDGGSLRLSYLPAGDGDDRRVVKSNIVNISGSKPVENSYSFVFAANGGDKILLSANAGVDGYGDNWKINYTISETTQNGKNVTEAYKLGLPVSGNGVPSKAEIKENTVWIGVDGNFADSDFMMEKVKYFNKYIPNLGIISASSNPSAYHNAEWFEDNGIPVLVQTFGSGYESYIEDNNAWEWDWNDDALNSNHWQDLTGTAHAFALPHYAVREVFSRIAKSAVTNGYSGFGYPDYVWMWGARGISGYNPETIEAFREDLRELDSGLRCDDGLWFFHDYYRYYTGSDTMITPQDVGFNNWLEYRPLSSAQNTSLNNSGVNTSTYWALFDALCNYEWLKFAQYIADLTHDNGGICQIMPNPEYYPDGVDYLFLNKLVNVDMTEDEYFGNIDWLDGAYHRWDYLSKYDGGVKNGGVMEAGGGGNGGSYYTNEIAYLSAFELGAMEYINHLEADFMYQGNTFVKERDGQIMSYGMGFSAAKELNLSKREADFTVVTSRNHLRPWATNVDWKPWDLRIGYESNPDLNISKMGYNFNGISQEGLLHGETDEIVVFSPHRVTESVWNAFIGKLNSGEIKTGIMSAGRFDTVVTDKLSTDSFSTIAPEYAYTDKVNISLPGHIIDAAGTTLTASRMSLNGGLKSPKSGDETVFSYKTYLKSYPLVVKRNVGEGEMYVLLFNDALTANFELAEFVYDRILAEKGVKPVFKSLENSGNPIEGYTVSNVSALYEKDIGVSARLYHNDDMIVAGVQNSLSRTQASTELTSTGSCTPYEIDGKTSAKILAEAGKEYKYIAIPSMQEGTATADADGYVTLSFEDTSYEIFFLLPANSSKNFDKIKSMQSDWREAVMFNVNAD